MKDLKICRTEIQGLLHIDMKQSGRRNRRFLFHAYSRMGIAIATLTDSCSLIKYRTRNLFAADLAADNHLHSSCHRI